MTFIKKLHIFLVVTIEILGVIIISLFYYQSITNYVLNYNNPIQHYNYDIINIIVKYQLLFIPQYIYILTFYICCSKLNSSLNNKSRINNEDITKALKDAITVPSVLRIVHLFFSIIYMIEIFNLSHIFDYTIVFVPLLYILNVIVIGYLGLYIFLIIPLKYYARLILSLVIITFILIMYDRMVMELFGILFSRLASRYSLDYPLISLPVAVVWIAINIYIIYLLKKRVYNRILLETFIDRR